jgi:hypothetical protein
VSRTVFRPSPALAGRGIGVGAIALGIAVAGYTATAATGVSGAARLALIIAAAVVGVLGLVVFGVGIIRLTGGGTRLVLDDDGFVNATGPGAGVRTGRWTDVRKVQTDGSVVSIDLAGGRQSIVRTRALGIDSRELARELRTRLQR